MAGRNPRFIDPELKSIFVAEAKKYLQTVQSVATAGAIKPDDLREAADRLHNLRGVASMVGEPDISFVADRLEKLLREHEATRGTGLRQRLATGVNTLRALIEGFASDDDEQRDAALEEFQVAFEHDEVGSSSDGGDGARAESGRAVIAHGATGGGGGTAAGVSALQGAHLSEPDGPHEVESGELDELRAFYAIEVKERLARITELCHRMQPGADAADDMPSLRAEWREIAFGAEAGEDPAVASVAHALLQELESADIKAFRQQWLDATLVIASFLDEVIGLAHADATRIESLEACERVLADSRGVAERERDRIDAATIDLGAEAQAEVLEFFIPESREQLERLNAALLDFERNLADMQIIHTIFRCTHTLKGSAATVGLNEFANVAHGMEDRIGAVRDGEAAATPELVQGLFADADRLMAMLRAIAGGATSAGQKARPQTVIESAVAHRFDEMEPELAEAFAAELSNTLSQLGHAVDRYVRNRGNVELLREIQRSAQNLGAAASAAGADPIVRRTDEIEQIAAAGCEDLNLVSEESVQALEDAVAAIARMVEPIVGSVRPTTAQVKRPETAEQIAAAAERRTLRIDAADLDEILDLVGELVITRSRLRALRAELHAMRNQMHADRVALRDLIDAFAADHEYNWQQAGGRTTDPGLRGHTRSMSNPGAIRPRTAGVSSVSGRQATVGSTALREFGALEWDQYTELNVFARDVRERMAEINSRGVQAEQLQVRLDDDLENIGRIIETAKDRVMELRMVPLKGVFSRLPRVLRDAAKASGKQVRLRISGADNRVDKAISDEIADSLVQLVRNSVAHGVEMPEERIRGGKDPVGTVHLRANTEGSRVVIEVDDDGAGLDTTRIRAIAVERGLVTHDGARSLSEEQVVELIFLPGFSTTETADALSGRGVGLDVVRENIKRLGGTVSVVSRHGQGSVFAITLPLTLSVMPGLVLRVGNHQFVLPLSSVVSTERFGLGEIDVRGNHESVRVRDEDVPLLRLQRLSAERQTKARSMRRLPVVIIGRDPKVAVMVDELIGIEDIVIKSLGAFLSSLRLFSGGAILGDGKLRLVFDPGFLVELAAGSVEGVYLARPTGEHRLPSVLVVDDSLSIRKVISGFLRSGGYRVDVAVDGEEAWQKLQVAAFDLVFTDLEMPRVHGYELLERIRGDERLHTMPVVVLSSRSGDKHRNKALALGAQEYLSKPVRQREVLATAKRCLEISAAAAAVAHEDERPISRPGEDALSTMPSLSGAGAESMTEQ